MPRCFKHIPSEKSHLKLGRKKNKKLPEIFEFPRNRQEILYNLYPDVGKGFLLNVSHSSPPPYTIEMFSGLYPLSNIYVLFFVFVYFLFGSKNHFNEIFAFFNY